MSVPSSTTRDVTSEKELDELRTQLAASAETFTAQQAQMEVFPKDKADLEAQLERYRDYQQKQEEYRIAQESHEASMRAQLEAHEARELAMRAREGALQTELDSQRDEHDARIADLQARLEDATAAAALTSSPSSIPAAVEEELAELLDEREKMEVQRAVLQDRLVQESESYRKLSLLLESTAALSSSQPGTGEQKKTTPTSTVYTETKASAPQRSRAREYLTSVKRKSALQLGKSLRAKEMTTLMSRMRVRSYPAGSIIYENINTDSDAGGDGGGGDTAITDATPGAGRLETLILLSGNLTEEREDDGDNDNDDDEDDDAESRPDGSVGSVYNELALLAPLTVDSTLRCDTAVTIGVLSMADMDAVLAQDTSGETSQKLLEAAPSDPLFLATAMTPHIETLRAVHASLEAGVDAAQKLAATTLEMEEQSAELADLREASAKHEEERAALETRLETSTSEVEALKKRTEKSTSIIAELNSRLVDRDERIAALSAETEHLQQDVDHARGEEEAHVRNLEADLVRMKENLEEANIRKRDLEHDVHELGEMKIVNERELQDALEMRRCLEEKVASLEAGEATLRDELETLRQQQLQQPMHQGKLEVVTKQWMESQRHLAQATQEKDELESRASTLQNDLDKMVAVLKENNRQLGESVRAKKELQEKVDAGETAAHEQASLRSQLIAAKQEVEAAKSEAAELRATASVTFSGRGSGRMLNDADHGTYAAAPARNRSFSVMLCKAVAPKAETGAEDDGETEASVRDEEWQMIPSTLDVSATERELTITPTIVATGAVGDAENGVVGSGNDATRKAAEDTTQPLPMIIASTSILSWSITDDAGRLLTIHVKRIKTKTKTRPKRKGSLTPSSTKTTVTTIEAIKLQTTSREESLAIISVIVESLMGSEAGGEQMNGHTAGNTTTASGYATSSLAQAGGSGHAGNTAQAASVSPTHAAIASVIDAMSTINDELQRKLDFPGDIIRSSAGPGSGVYDHPRYVHANGGGGGGADSYHVPMSPRFAPSPEAMHASSPRSLGLPSYYHDSNGSYLGLQTAPSQQNISFLERELNQSKEEAEELRIQLNFLESVSIDSIPPPPPGTDEASGGTDAWGAAAKDEDMHQLQKELEEERKRNALLESKLHERDSASTSPKSQADTSSDIVTDTGHAISPPSAGAAKSNIAIRRRASAPSPASLRQVVEVPSPPPSSSSMLPLQNAAATMADHAGDDESKQMLKAMMAMMKEQQQQQHQQQLVQQHQLAQQHQLVKQQQQLVQQRQKRKKMERMPGAPGSQPPNVAEDDMFRRARAGSSAEILQQLSSVKQEMSSLSTVPEDEQQHQQQREELPTVSTVSVDSSELSHAARMQKMSTDEDVKEVVVTNEVPKPTPTAVSDPSISTAVSSPNSRTDHLLNVIDGILGSMND